MTQYANTALLIAYLRRRTGLDVPGLVDAAVARAKALGFGAYVWYGLAVVSFQVLPFQLSAFIAVLFAGVLFGVWKGTLIVTLACATSALISRSLAQTVQQRWPSINLGMFGKRMAALEARLGKAHVGTATAVVALLRLSPMFPFVPTNYLLGLTSIDPRAVFAGTFLGCLLPQAAIVSAGVVGASALGGSIYMCRPSSRRWVRSRRWRRCGSSASSPSRRSTREDLERLWPQRWACSSWPRPHPDTRNSPSHPGRCRGASGSRLQIPTFSLARVALAHTCC
mmetsp:Transcript_18483/g.43602  ORF Transcript_18483/g.43602 Transcript_18483/m.43602 type:complete len:282 (+) Transcript_18483:1-846(+)